MRLSIVLLPLLVLVSGCAKKRADVAMFAGDCGAVVAHVQSIAEVPADTVDTTRSMCASHDLSQSDATCLTKAKVAAEAKFCVDEAIKWMKFRNDR
jgi:hypothetical protein